MIFSITFLGAIIGITLATFVGGLDESVFFASQYGEALGVLWGAFLGFIFASFNKSKIMRRVVTKSEMSVDRDVRYVEKHAVEDIEIGIGDYRKVRLDAMNRDIDEANSTMRRFSSRNLSVHYGAILGAIYGAFLGALIATFFVTQEGTFSTKLINAFNNIGLFIWTLMQIPSTSLFLILLAIIFGLHKINPDRSKE